MFFFNVELDSLSVFINSSSSTALNNFRDKANIVAGADVDLNKLHYFHSLLEKYYAQAKKDGKNRIRINMTRETQPILMDVLRKTQY